MQTVFLTFYKRITLWNMVGNHSVSGLKQAEVYLRLIGKLRPTDEETESVNLQNNGMGVSWQLPVPTFGDKDIELERSEADALIAAIEVAQFRVVDAAWLQEIADQLKKKPPKKETDEARAEVEEPVLN